MINHNQLLDNYISINPKGNLEYELIKIKICPDEALLIIYRYTYYIYMRLLIILKKFCKRFTPALGAILSRAIRVRKNSMGP